MVNEPNNQPRERYLDKEYVAEFRGGPLAGKFRPIDQWANIIRIPEVVRDFPNELTRSINEVDIHMDTTILIADEKPKVIYHIYRSYFKRLNSNYLVFEYEGVQNEEEPF